MRDWPLGLYIKKPGLRGVRSLHGHSIKKTSHKSRKPLNPTLPYPCTTTLQLMWEQAGLRPVLLGGTGEGYFFNAHTSVHLRPQIRPQKGSNPSRDGEKVSLKSTAQTQACKTTLRYHVHTIVTRTLPRFRETVPQTCLCAHTCNTFTIQVQGLQSKALNKRKDLNQITVLVLLAMTDKIWLWLM
jgi:hypothetical protein